MAFVPEGEIEAALLPLVKNPDKTHVPFLCNHEIAFSAPIKIEGKTFKYVCSYQVSDILFDSGIAINYVPKGDPPFSSIVEYVRLRAFKSEYQRKILEEVAKSKELATFENLIKERQNLIDKIKSVTFVA